MLLILGEPLLDARLGDLDALGLLLLPRDAEADDLLGDVLVLRLGLEAELFCPDDREGLAERVFDFEDFEPDEARLFDLGGFFPVASASLPIAVGIATARIIVAAANTANDFLIRETRISEPPAH